MLVFLSADAKGQYSLSRPRKLESLIDAGAYSATMQRFNSIPSVSQSQMLIHLFAATGFMILGCLVPAFRGGSDHTSDAIDWTCMGIGITVGSIWTFYAVWKSIQLQRARSQQLQVIVDEVDREYEQLSIATGRPRICWSLMNLFGQENNTASSYAKHIQIEVCCPHLMQHMNHLQPPPSQQAQQVQVVTAVPVYHSHQPQYYPQQQQQQQQQHRDVEMSIAAPSRNSQSAAHYPDLENPLLR